MIEEKKFRTKDGTRTLLVPPDVVDLRDRYYKPALLKLKHQIIPKPCDLKIRDQGTSSACTAFALASVIDRQVKAMTEDENKEEDDTNAEETCCEDEEEDNLSDEELNARVSTRMLFRMAQLHDDLPDEKFAGSTLRGALKGFFHNGVCREADARFNKLHGMGSFALTMDIAKRAREVTLGAYYRLNHEINDYHTAINEAGAVIASAKIHSGWARPASGKITRSTTERGRHAFAIVGYDREGFLVQNSWGKRWSTFQPEGCVPLKGVAHWTYDDWFENVEDAWVLRLAISSPEAFRVKFARNHRVFRKAKETGVPFVARRQDIVGHFLHINDGDFVSRGRYAQGEADVDALIAHLKDASTSAKREFDHVLFVAHGALQSAPDVAARVKAWSEVFHGNRIYPIHIMWETAFNNQVVDVVRDLLLKTGERMNKGDKYIDDRLEELARPLGQKLWRDLKRTARLSLCQNSRAGEKLHEMLEVTQPLKLHFLSQSAGVMLFSGFLPHLKDTGRVLDTATLMAPACSVKYYERYIKPAVGQTAREITQYNLTKQRELKDKLGVYSKSLLYLVANAIETERPPNGHKGTPLLGLEEYEADFDLPKKGYRLFHAGRQKDEKITDAKSHRGFDKDQKTMNHLLATILGKPPETENEFREAHLTGY